MANSSTHHILFYEYVDDMAEQRGPYREAHLARIFSEREAGRLVMAGALGDPPHGGALVFRDVSPPVRDGRPRHVAPDRALECRLILAAGR